VCSGSCVLAAAGLLDGKSATTHWSRTHDFGRKFPKVRLDADRIFVKQGKYWTSAGITAGIDLSLALIAEDLGERVARQTAQQLVVYYRRPGGQSQFSALLDLERIDGRFAGCRVVRIRRSGAHAALFVRVLGTPPSAVKRLSARRTVPS
jgi:transcriptional regulator GlxA family with amidase domain